ncbi:MAG: tetratricopeptide repeat protein [Acidobacteriota bacterium]
MKSHNRVAAACLIVLSTLTLAGCTKLKARDELNKGVRAFKDAQYETAVERFKSAVDLDPDLLNAHLYLATAYAAQYVPGGESDENKRLGQEAIKAFETVLQRDPTNVGSVKGIAGIYLNMREFEKAKQYYLRTTELEPNNPEPYYSIGNVNWVLCYDKQNPLPPDRKSELIEEGLKALNKAVELDPNYYNAYFYINLLHRQKAQVVIDEFVDKNPRQKDQFAAAALDPKALDSLVKRSIPNRYAEYEQHLNTADQNFEKAMAIKKQVEAKAETTGVIDASR